MTNNNLADVIVAQALQRITTADRWADYRRRCETVGVQPRDLL